MSPRRAGALLTALLLAACSSRAEPTAAPTTTTASSTTSTTGAFSTTTTEAVPHMDLPPIDGAVGAIRTASGVVAAVLGPEEANGEWPVRLPCSGEGVAEGTPLTGAHVVLDPGHGGDEDGAVGPNGLREKDLNLAVAERAADLLDAAGATVVLTRTADYRITLQARAEIAVGLHPLAFVSIHHNAEPDGPLPRPGTETYYQVASTDSKRLAGLLYEEVVDAFDRYDLAWVGDTDAGAKYRRASDGGDYYGILRRSEAVPAALVESAFLSDPAEAELLARPDVQQAEAVAIARGVARYLTTDDPGSGFTVPYPRTEPAGPGGGATGCVDPPLT